MYTFLYLGLILHLTFLLSYYVVILFQWLSRELALLQNLIDRANEKGWRREYPFLILIR